MRDVLEKIIWSNLSSRDGGRGYLWFSQEGIAQYYNELPTSLGFQTWNRLKKSKIESIISDHKK